MRGEIRRAFQGLIVLLPLPALPPPAFDGCSLPPPPSRIPDGATASDEEMQAMMLTMSHFETDVENYVKCVAFEAKQGRLSPQEQGRLAREALDKHQATLQKFNAQMRVYMAR
jgi:hypothetical protein